MLTRHAYLALAYCVTLAWGELSWAALIFAVIAHSFTMAAIWRKAEENGND